MKLLRTIGYNNNPFYLISAPVGSLLWRQKWTRGTWMVIAGMASFFVAAGISLWKAGVLGGRRKKRPGPAGVEPAGPGTAGASSTAATGGASRAPCSTTSENFRLRRKFSEVVERSEVRGQLDFFQDAFASSSLTLASRVANKAAVRR
jgi:hypothetical protein